MFIWGLCNVHLPVQSCHVWNGKRGLWIRESVWHIGFHHTWNLSRTLRTLSVEQKCPCGAILLMWIKIAPHDKQFCLSWQAILLVMWSNLIMWSNLAHLDQNFSTSQAILLVMTSNFACHVEQFVITPHEFTIYAALLWFTLFWRKIHFVAIYALLCGAKFNPNILSVEQKWQISCMSPILNTPSQKHHMPHQIHQMVIYSVCCEFVLFQANKSSTCNLRKTDEKYEERSVVWKKSPVPVAETFLPPRLSSWPTCQLAATKDW